MLTSTISVTVSKEGPTSPCGEVSTLKNQVKKLEEELRLVHTNQFNIVKHLEKALDLARTWIDSSKWGPGPSPRTKSRVTRKHNLFLDNVLRKASELTETLTTTKISSDRYDNSDRCTHLAPPDLKLNSMRHRIPTRKTTVNKNSRRTSITESMPVTSSSRIIGVRKDKRRLGVFEEKDHHKSEQPTSVTKQISSPSRMGELTPECNSEVYDILSESIPGYVGSNMSIPSFVQAGPGHENYEVQEQKLNQKEREKEKIMHSKLYALANIENSVSNVLEPIERRSLVKLNEPKLVRMRFYGINEDEGELQSDFDWSSRIGEQEIRVSLLDDKEECSLRNSMQLTSSSKLLKRPVIISRSSFK